MLHQHHISHLIKEDKLPRNLSREQRQNQIGTISQTTILHRIGEWTRNVIANEFKIRNSKGVNWLFEKMKGIPTILVGAGPSLDKNIDLLKECKNKAVIIACSSALKPMLEKDIIPDIVFVTDSKPKEMRLMLEESGFYSKDYAEQMILICDSFVHPSVYEDWNGEIFFYNIRTLESCPFTHSLIEFTGQIGQLGAGGSVTTIMLCFAYGGLKCEPVIFVGQDCGYYEPPKHHVSNHSSGVADLTKAYAPIETTDYQERKCFTNKALLSFCYWFEDFCLGNPGTYINATEGGILTVGVTHQPLQSVLDNHLKQEYNIRDLLLNPDTVIDGAKPENRWIYKSTDPAGKSAPILKRETYFTGELLDHIVSTIPPPDLITNICKHTSLVSNLINPESKDSQLKAFIKDIVNESSIEMLIDLDTTEWADLIPDSADMIYSINKTENASEDQMIYIASQAERTLKDNGMFICFATDKKAIPKIKLFFDDVSVVGVGFFTDASYEIIDANITGSKKAESFGDYDSFSKELIISGDSYAKIVKEEEAEIFACVAKKKSNSNEENIPDIE